MGGRSFVPRGLLGAGSTTSGIFSRGCTGKFRSIETAVTGILVCRLVRELHVLERSDGGDEESPFPVVSNDTDVGVDIRDSIKIIEGERAQKQGHEQEYHPPHPVQAALLRCPLSPRQYLTGT
jgi:hypothetical protein